MHRSSGEGFVQLRQNSWCWLTGIVLGSFAFGACGFINYEYRNQTGGPGETTGPADGDLAAIDPPRRPEAELAFGLKQLDLAWSATDNTTHYRLREQNDDGSSSVLVDNIPAQQLSLSLDIPAHMQSWSSNLLLEACNSGGCTASDPISLAPGMLSTIGYFKASNTQASDAFGFSVALSADGRTLAVGAPGEDSGHGGIDGNQNDNSANGSGAVYLFAREASGWAQQAYIKASNPRAWHAFGFAVALSGDGNTLVVGSPGESSSADGINGNQNDNSASDAGAVYAFVRSGSAWSQQAYIKASNSGAGDNFGETLALSRDGNTLAVGAAWEDSSAVGIGGDQSNEGRMNSGSTYVFSRSGSAWSQQAYIKAPNPDVGDNFGHATALSASGDMLAVGAIGENSNATGINGNQGSNSAHEAGAVYVLTRSGSTWSHRDYIKASNTTSGMVFGYALALSEDGSRLASGAPFEDGGASGINGNQADTSANNAGAAYVFARNGSGWSQQAYIKASNPQPNFLFGMALAMSGDGNTLAVGSPAEGSSTVGINSVADVAAPSAGAGYVFRQLDGAWSQRSYVKAPNTDAGDDLGTSLALSADGNTLAINAAEGERSNATGINGNQTDNSLLRAGAVYLY